MTKWAIWCVVDGGVTGHREAYMKQNGQPILYDTALEAEYGCPPNQELHNGAWITYEPMPYTQEKR